LRFKFHPGLANAISLNKAKSVSIINDLDFWPNTYILYHSEFAESAYIGHVTYVIFFFIELFNYLEQIQFSFSEYTYSICYYFNTI